MKAPGKAYNNPTLGRDPQPDHMSKYVMMPDTDEGDNGGVHINSGIPNKAFYLTAMGIGGYAWEAPGHIWYAALKASSQWTNFQEFADITHLTAGQLYGSQSTEQQAVVSAWKEVGIRISGVQALAATTGRMRYQPAAAAANGRHDDGGGDAEDRAALEPAIEAVEGGRRLEVQAALTAADTSIASPLTAA